MKNQLKLRNAALVTALAAVAATAWATTEYTTSSYSDLDAQEVVVTQDETVITPAEPAVAAETATTNTETIVVNEIPAPAAAPVAERSVAAPPLTVEDRRLTEDQRIQALVMDKLAAAPNITGLIGVESKDAVVTLTGYTVTAAQAQRAGRHAGSVEGVKSVQNEIRARIGGSV
jgi:hypothetical protein